MNFERFLNVIVLAIIILGVGAAGWSSWETSRRDKEVLLIQRSIHFIALQEDVWAERVESVNRVHAQQGLPLVPEQYLSLEELGMVFPVVAERLVPDLKRFCSKVEITLNRSRGNFAIAAHCDVDGDGVASIFPFFKEVGVFWHQQGRAMLLQSAPFHLVKIF